MPAEAILFTSLQKPFYGIPAAYVIRRITGHAGAVAKTQHEVRFTDTRRAKKDDIFFAFNLNSQTFIPMTDLRRLTRHKVIFVF